MTSLEAICAELRSVAEDDSMSKEERLDTLRHAKDVIEDCISTVEYSD
jgi:hypothetical protein